MTEEQVNQANAIAKMPYRVDVARDETTDGRPVFFLSCPELPGCMAQGWTTEEALSSLELAKFDYIVSLLQDGLSVPLPEVSQSVTVGSDDTFDEDTFVDVGDRGFEAILEKATKKGDREELYQLVVER